MPNTKAELLALKQDLIKVRELIMNSLSKSSNNDVVSDKKITKVNYDKVRDADFEDLDEQ